MFPRFGVTGHRRCPITPREVKNSRPSATCLFRSTQAAQTPKKPEIRAVDSDRPMGKITFDLSRRRRTAAEWAIAGGIGIYITGVTVFARTEARTSSRWRLVGGVIIMIVGATITALSAAIDWQAQNIFAKHGLGFWFLIGCGAPLMLASFCILAIIRPDPRLVQFGVRRALRGLIFLDFIAAALSSPGSGWPLVILFLIVPTSLLERRFSTT